MGHPAPCRGALVAALALALTAAACSDAPDSALPTEVAVAREGIGVACSQGTIRNRIDRLYPGGPVRAWAHQTFNQALKDDGAGFAAEADLGFTGLATDVFARWARNELRSSLTSLEPVVDDLVARLYACADIAAPDLDDLLPPDLGAIHDLAIGAGVPGQPFQVATPSGNFALTGGGDFLDGPAVFVVFRMPDTASLSYSQYTEYPPVYRIRVDPYDAQANYDDGEPTDGVPGAPWATVSICPGDPHHRPLSDLRVLRREDPMVGYGSGFLDPEPAAGVTCSGLPPYLAAAPGAGGDRSLGGRLATLWRRAVHGAGDLLVSAFVPPPLYAVDGGIGGRAELLSDFVVARPWVGPD